MFMLHDERFFDRLMPVVRQTMERWNKRVPTGELNRWFEAAVAKHTPPLADAPHRRTHRARGPLCPGGD